MTGIITVIHRVLSARVRIFANRQVSRRFPRASKPFLASTRWPAVFQVARSIQSSRCRWYDRSCLWDVVSPQGIKRENPALFACFVSCKGFLLTNMEIREVRDVPWFVQRIREECDELARDALHERDACHRGERRVRFHALPRIMSFSGARCCAFNATQSCQRHTS